MYSGIMTNICSVVNKGELIVYHLPTLIDNKPLSRLVPHLECNISNVDLRALKFNKQYTPTPTGMYIQSC